MKRKYTSKELIAFEAEVARRFELGEINCPVHLSGGNELAIIAIFEQIKDEDWVFSTHRNHYHYLLKGGDPKGLMDELLGLPTGVCGGVGRSMHITDSKINFYTSAIIGGTAGIASGVALALKKKKSTAEVWCFVGDGTEDHGHYVEALRFSYCRGLPVMFVVEDNQIAVESTPQERWGTPNPLEAKNVIRYSYKRVYPHVGTGNWVSM